MYILVRAPETRKYVLIGADPATKPAGNNAWPTRSSGCGAVGSDSMVKAGSPRSCQSFSTFAPNSLSVIKTKFPGSLLPPGGGGGGGGGAGGSATSKLVVVTGARIPELNLTVCGPLPMILRSVNVATPLTAL